MNYTHDYLLDKKIKIRQPTDGYRASSDAVLLSAFVDCPKPACRILDVGSGTGAISLCLAHRFAEKNIEIKGVDIQKDLVDLADLSAKDNEFSFVSFYHHDIREKFNDKDLPFCTFDIVVTNPPYSDHDMPSPNLSKATAHNHHNFNLSSWLNFCLKMTKPFGKIYMINRTECLSELFCALEGKAGNIIVLPIYSKNNQDAKRVLICAQKDSKAPCRILPPFVLHEADGKYTENCEKILRKGMSFAQLLQL